MDSAELLDLLGNANRRRILRLLARKPCYVTEIGEYLGVSPKAVIDHLEKLEAAGLVESRVDDGRRKYFSIARNLRLEVSVSPYEFGVKSAYAAGRGLDMTTCRHLSIRVEADRGTDLPELATRLHELEQLENELSLAQRWAQGRIADVREGIAETVDGIDPRLVTPILRALAEDPGDVERLAAADFDRLYPGHRDDVEAPNERIAEILHHHEERTERVVDVLAEHGPATAWEVSAELFGELSGIHILHGPGEAYAHLVELEEAGHVERTGREYTLLSAPDGEEAR